MKKRTPIFAKAPTVNYTHDDAFAVGLVGYFKFTAKFVNIAGGGQAILVKNFAQCSAFAVMFATMPRSDIRMNGGRGDKGW